jgi:hypothetical protein
MMEYVELNRFHRDLGQSDFRFKRAEPTAASRFRRFARFGADEAAQNVENAQSAGLVPDASGPVFSSTRTRNGGSY